MAKRSLGQTALLIVWPNLDDPHHLLFLLVFQLLDLVESFGLLLAPRVTGSRVQLEQPEISCIVIRVIAQSLIQIS